MLNFMPNLKLDKASDTPAGGAPPAAAPPLIDPNPAPIEPTAEDFGYDTPAVDPAAKEDPKEPIKEIVKEEVVEPASGYDGEKDPVAPKEEPKPKEETPPVVPDELDPMVEGLPKDEADGVKAFAKKHGFTKEQVKAYTDLRKDELSQFESAKKSAIAQQENEKLKTRASWHKELKEDQDFGGENFKKSIADVDKVLNDFMPGMKKSLTERGAMLPPYVMRDLKALAAHLYSKEKLVQGDVPTPKVDEKVEDDALAYYE